MTTLPSIQPLPPDLSDRTITLTLNLRTEDMVSVRSCEVVGRWFRNRVSFQEHRSIDDVLVFGLAAAIRSCLNRVPESAHVLALPDFLVEIPGLVLSGVHVMEMEAQEGTRSAILRFQEFTGAINNAFCLDIGFQEPCQTQAEKLAVNVLEDICMPILDLCRTLQDKSTNRANEAFGRLADHAHEFEFQIELLKRYVQNTAMQTAALQTHHVDGGGSQYPKLIQI